MQLSEHGKFNLKLGLRAKTLGDNKVVYELQIKNDLQTGLIWNLSALLEDLLIFM